MALAPGQKLANYEILAPLGAGGMGEVWRARDVRLGREVAIKALPDAFARDPERMARFEREAKLLASLNHPNIGAIYGLEVVDGHRYLVLEFLEGESLSAILSRGALPLAEALEVCGHVAGALESAHESGIVHRDLKPGNVMVLRNGAVKVLDFGLAKGDGGHGSELGASASPTMTYGATQAGIVLGTAAYMSPEQARGKVVDKRTDIWSFGCVLFECLTGRQAFEGETVSDLIAHILTSEPDWNTLPAATPLRVRELMRRCLEKDSRRRLRDMGDARIELEETLAPRGSSYGVPASIAASVDAASRPKRAGVGIQLLAAVAGAVLGVLATKLVSPLVGSREPARSPVRFSIVETDTMKIQTESANVALSPDGTLLAFVASDSGGTPLVWVRPLAGLDPRALHGTDNAQLPFFSPDGQSIGFFTETKLKKVAIATGEVDDLAAVKRARGGTWNKRGQIVYAPTSDGPLFVVPASGGEPRQVTVLDTLRGESGQRFPCFLPDGRRFLYASLPPVGGRYRILVGNLDGGRPDSVASVPSGARYAAPGWLLYSNVFTIGAQRFDAGSRKVRGNPIPTREHVWPTNFSGSPSVAVAGARALAYLQFPVLLSKLVWIDAQGREIGSLPFPAGIYGGDLELSPDGSQILFNRAEGLGPLELWIGDVRTGAETRFETDPLVNSSAHWSPDGTKVAWLHSNAGPQDVWVRAVTGGERKRGYLLSDRSFKVLDGWTPDGRSLIIDRQDPATRWDLWTIDVESGVGRPLVAGPYNEQGCAISPDGKWIAYMSDETGRSEIYVQSYPALGRRVQITTGGAFRPDWTYTGQLTFAYTKSPNVQQIADVQPASEFKIGPVRPWVAAPATIQAGDAGRDGRLVALLPAGKPDPNKIVVVLDWPSTLPKP